MYTHKYIHIYIYIYDTYTYMDEYISLFIPDDDFLEIETGREIKSKIILQAKYISLKIYYLFVIIYVYVCIHVIIKSINQYRNYIFSLHLMYNKNIT